MGRGPNWAPEDLVPKPEDTRTFRDVKLLLALFQGAYFIVVHALPQIHTNDGKRADVFLYLFSFIRHRPRGEVGVQVKFDLWVSNV